MTGNSVGDSLVGPTEVERTYEIGFDGDVVDLVRRIRPDAQLRSVPTYTVLWHWIRAAEELDVFLDALLTLGITPHEVYGSAGGLHRQVRRTVLPERPIGGAVAGRHAPAAYCEVRIDGRLGDAILRHLRWSHCSMQSTVVRVRASHDALRAMLTEMAAADRLDYVVLAQPE